MRAARGRHRRRRAAAGLLTFVALLAVACDRATDGGQAESAPPDEAVGDPVGELAFAGPDDGALLNAEALAVLRFEVTATDGQLLDDVVLVHGDRAVDAARSGDTLAWSPTELSDGDHVVVVQRSPDDATAAPAAADEAQPDPAPETLHTWRFALDTTPPELEVRAPLVAVVAGTPIELSGVTEPGATVSAADTDTIADGDGVFAIELSEVTDGDLEVVATDAAGNRTSTSHTLRTVPSRVEVDAMRGVHVTAHAWMHDGLRSGVLAMVEDGTINTVALTLKDEGGRIGWDSDVQLAIDSGANEGVYDLHQTIADLHELGVHVVGRIVAFRDPKLGPWARDNGHRDWLVHDVSGELHTGRYECCFTDFSHPAVVEYNLAIAEEAAAAGIDGILWDYIRKPDGPRENLVYRNIDQDEPLEPHIVAFTRLAAERLAPYGVTHGASLYGIAADRPTQIAQDVPAMSQHLDYVAPMIYPSHWGPGEYGVADPNRQPYDIIAATLQVWQGAVQGTDTRIAPWLEDTAYRAWDRPHQIREQLRATADQGIEEWLMWDPSVRYTPSAYR